MSARQALTFEQQAELAARRHLGLHLVGSKVRFAHQLYDQNAQEYTCVAMNADGMVELAEMTGWFAPHIFVAMEPPHRGKS